MEYHQEDQRFFELKLHFKNKYISKKSKLIYLVKFLIPSPIFKYFVFIQKIKLKIIEKVILKFI